MEIYVGGEMCQQIETKNQQKKHRYMYILYKTVLSILTVFKESVKCSLKRAFYFIY